MPQSHFVLIFFLWLIWVKQSIIFNSVLFLHYVTCSRGQHWHAGWKIVPSTSLHPLVVSISSTLLKAALLLPLLGLLKSFLLEMLCCTFPRLGCGWLCPAWQEVVCWFLSWVFKSSQRCSMFSLLGSQVELSWLWTPRKAFFPSTLAQILSWCKALLPAPAVFNIYLAAPSSFTSRLCYPALVPQNTQISRKKKIWKRKKPQISLLVMKSFHTLPWPPCSLFLLFFSVLESISFSAWAVTAPDWNCWENGCAEKPELHPEAAPVCISCVAKFRKCHAQPSVTSSSSSSSGRPANPALPREVRAGISPCTGNSSYSSTSLPLPGAPVLGAAAAFWGIFIL